MNVKGTIRSGVAYFRGNLGLEAREPWVVSEDGTHWSCYDVTFRPDDPKEFELAYNQALLRAAKRDLVEPL